MKQTLFKVILLLVIIQANLFSQNNTDFIAETIDNNEIQFSDIYKKGPTLINFWALWCKPCRSEMKHLEKLYQKYKDQNFTIIGINQDTPRSLAKVKSYISTHNITYPVLTDPNKELFEQFNGQTIPLSILYDKAGNVQYTHIGYLPGDENKLEDKIKELLGSEK